jgi:thymidine kinase
MYTKRAGQLELIVGPMFAGKEKRVGSLELIIGPMFAGKSTALLAKIRRHKAIGQNVFVITHSSDKRYSESAVVSHDRQYQQAHSVAELMPLLSEPAFNEACIIAIEEGQFFGDLLEFVEYAVEIHGKHVVVCGLDGDVERKPFGQILTLIPLANSLLRVSALCKICADGTVANFTASKKGIKKNSIGGENEYYPVCRYHHNLSRFT